MPKKLLILGLVAAALLAAVIGARSFSKKPSSQPKAGGARSTVLSVYTHTATQAPLEERITTTGTILADEGVELTAESSGLITALNITEGGRVSKGDLLVKINDAELQAKSNDLPAEAITERALMQIAQAGASARRSR